MSTLNFSFSQGVLGTVSLTCDCRLCAWWRTFNRSRPSGVEWGTAIPWNLTGLGARGIWLQAGMCESFCLWHPQDRNMSQDKQQAVWPRNLFKKTSWVYGVFMFHVVLYGIPYRHDFSFFLVGTEAMLPHAVPHAPSAFPKSRCPPNLTPPPSSATPVSLQTRTASVKISGCFGHYRIQGSDPQEVQSLLQTDANSTSIRISTSATNATNSSSADVTIYFQWAGEPVWPFCWALSFTECCPIDECKQFDSGYSSSLRPFESRQSR